MAAKSAVEVEGARELRAALKNLNADLGDLTALHREIGAMVAGVAAARAPALTGALAGSVRAGATRTKAMVRAGSARVPYANPIHWGWPSRNIDPNPFIADAAHATESQWVARYQAEADRLLTKAANSAR